MGMGFKRCKMIKNDTQRCKNLYIVKSVMNGNEKRPTYIYISLFTGEQPCCESECIYWELKNGPKECLAYLDPDKCCSE